MQRLYYHATPNSMKVLVLIHELGLTPTLIPVDIFAGEQHAPDFLKINPNAKVPALVDAGVTLFDSHAILLHLAEKHRAFLPTKPEARAQALSWLMLVATGLSPFSGQSIHFRHYAPEPLPYAIARFDAEVRRHYRVLETRLAEASWLAGEYSVADMALWGWAASAGFVLGEAALAPFPNLTAFMTRMAARPAVQKALETKAAHAFATKMDATARRALFGQG